MTADQARALVQSATPGPWTWIECGPHAVGIDAPSGERRLEHVTWESLAVVHGSEDDPRAGLHVARRNAELICAAHDLAETVVALEAKVARLRVSYKLLVAAAGCASETLCPECGPAVQVDEDGCCIGCGNGAMGTYVTERADALVAALEAAP